MGFILFNFCRSPFSQLKILTFITAIFSGFDIVRTSQLVQIYQTSSSQREEVLDQMSFSKGSVQNWIKLSSAQIGALSAQCSSVCLRFDKFCWAWFRVVW